MSNILPNKCVLLEEFPKLYNAEYYKLGDTVVEHYSLPSVADATVIEYLTKFKTRVSRRPFYLKMVGARLMSVALVSPDGSAVCRDSSSAFGMQLDDHWLLHSNESFPEPSILENTSIAVCFHKRFAYYHWLFDELTRLLLLDRDILKNARNIITTGMMPEVVDLLGIKHNIIIPQDSSHYQAEELIIPNLLAYSGFPIRKQIDLLNDFVSAFKKPPRHFGERLYVTRQRTNGRRVLNENEVWPVLEKSGYRKIFFEDLTWREQVHAMHHAKSVVGPHGANLANTVFCQSGTQVIEFLHHNYFHHCYWLQCSARGLEYYPIVDYPEKTIALTAQGGGKDIHVNIDKLKKLIK